MDSIDFMFYHHMVLDFYNRSIGYLCILIYSYNYGSFPFAGHLNLYFQTHQDLIAVQIFSVPGKQLEFSTSSIPC